MTSSRQRGTPAFPVWCAILLSLTVGCARETGSETQAIAASLPRWAWDSSMVFPADRSLARPEDGVALPDGRLLVADQIHGLRRVSLDGTSEPFGDLPGAGYVHRPPERSGGANGVSLEPGGRHLLVADIFHGGIYRVDVVTGATERIYQHRYGVNTAVRDSRGAIWFTQSAHNTPDDGEARMWHAVDLPQAEGALLRLGVREGGFEPEAEVVIDSLFFANGLALDEAQGHLYLSETIGGRVLRYTVHLEAGRVSDRTVIADSAMVDNLELDGDGNLWMALPLTNEVQILNAATGQRRIAFRLLTPEQQNVGHEFLRRGASGAARMELLTPALWAPLPGFITGVILGPGGKPVYLSGLGDALVRLP